MLKESIEEAFLLLENNFNIKYSNKTATRSKLIEAFSQTELSPSNFLGYQTNNGLSKAMSRLFVERRHDKLSGQDWRDWLLYKTDKFLCKKCYNIFQYNDRYDIKSNECISCNTEKTTSKRNKNRTKIYNYLLVNPCADCGEKDPIVLEFDHLDPKNKNYNISNMMSYSWEKIEKEIEKCQVVCANCHRRRTASTYNWYAYISPYRSP